MKRLSSVASSLALVAFGTGALAQTSNTDSSAAMSKTMSDSGGISTSVGVRLWGNQWDIPVFDTVPVATPQGGVVFQDVATSHLSSFQIAAIPYAGVRMGNVVASISYFIRTDYDVKTPIVNDASRSELDVTLGYSVLPTSSDGSLLISVGYKNAHVDEAETTTIGRQGSASTRINALLFGFSGIAPLTDNWRLYGSAAYGFAKQKTNFSDSLQEVNDHLDGRYKVGEVGLSYAFYRGTEGQAIRNASVALGYRAQVYTIKSFSLLTRNAMGDVIATQTRNIDTTTQGPVLTFNASF